MKTDSLGNDWFYNAVNDSMRISTRALPCEFWIFGNISDTSFITATVSRIEVETVFGISDSTKIISFKAASIQNDSVFCDLGMTTLKLSKHFGLLQSIGFYEYQLSLNGYPVILNLAGISDPELGVRNLGSRDVYHYDPGDEFSTMHKEESFNRHYYDFMFWRILRAEWSPDIDSVTYLVDQWEHTYGNDNISGSYDHYQRDTIELVYDFNSIYINCVDACSGQDYHGDRYQKLTSAYNGRIVKEAPRLSYIK
ncbi:MAG: hypothetical protein HXX13_12570 [Bacteroidetes bacterium]|nr:hypothetical protein [Bacteroidota bacterium]